MTSYIFIVDSNTFKYHLEYLFAGVVVFIQKYSRAHPKIKKNGFLPPSS
ncbi:MAG: hypothetical protein J6M05_03695 [Cardiobacteriaceae bacterium]|nr:hypothetical protein [Cardiobacteriaceae bacterium]